MQSTYIPPTKKLENYRNNMHYIVKKYATTEEIHVFFQFCQEFFNS